MYVLNEEQVTFILNDIRRNGIELEELQLGLLDHICCIIENEMPPEQNFEEFYRSVIPRFFKRELREIQEETDLLLTFKHYYAMRKVMIMSGACSAIGFIIGSFFKIMHWPGAAILLLLAIATISLVFLPLLFILKAKESKNRQEKTILGLGIIIGILFCISTLFKVQHWPGANIMWLSCLGILFFLFLPLYFFSGIRNPETKVNTIVSSILILVAGGLLFTLTSLRPSRWIDHAYSTANKHVFQDYDFATQQVVAQYANLESDSAIAKTEFLQLKKSCSDLCSKIEKIKTALLEQVNSRKGESLSMEEAMDNYAGNYDIPTHLLFSEGAPKAQLTSIKEDIENLRSLVSSKFDVKDVALLNTANAHKFGDETQEVISWENANYYRIPLDLVIHNLTQLQLNIRMIEAACINRLNS